MTATNERTGTPRTSRSPSSTRRRHRRRHADAVIQAEVRRLARALAPYREEAEITGFRADFYASREVAPSKA